MQKTRLVLGCGGFQLTLLFCSFGQFIKKIGTILDPKDSPGHRINPSLWHTSAPVPSAPPPPRVGSPEGIREAGHGPSAPRPPPTHPAAPAQRTSSAASGHPGGCPPSLRLMWLVSLTRMNNACLFVKPHEKKCFRGKIMRKIITYSRKLFFSVQIAHRGKPQLRDNETR